MLKTADDHPRTRNDMPASRRARMIELLNARLADAIDLGLQAKQAHWNAKGPSFFSLHELFDRVAEAVARHVDLIAERAVQLGGVAEGTVRTAAERSSLGVHSAEVAAGATHVAALAGALASFGKTVRAAIDEAAELGDAGTADLLTEVSRDIDKHLWFVEAHLQPEV